MNDLEIVLYSIWYNVCGRTRDRKVPCSFEDFNALFKERRGWQPRGRSRGRPGRQLPEALDMNGGVFAEATGEEAWGKLTSTFKILALLNSYQVPL